MVYNFQPILPDEVILAVSTNGEYGLFNPNLFYNSVHRTEVAVLISFPPSMWIPQASWQSGRAGRHKAAGLHAALKSAPGKRVMATMSFVSLRHGLSILKTSLPR